MSEVKSNAIDVVHHLKIFDSHSQPADWAIKKIEGGRLKGKSDINPQWRIYALTKLFGLCGFGWKYSIDTIDFREGGKGEKAVFVTISMHVKMDGEWSDAIIGCGGSMFVESEKSGPFTSDEAIKMATTDAISVCCKLLGIAGNIYSGSKYLPLVPRGDAPKEPVKPIVKKPILMVSPEFEKSVEALLAGKTMASIEKYYTMEADVKTAIENRVKELIEAVRVEEENLKSNPK